MTVLQRFRHKETSKQTSKQASKGTKSRYGDGVATPLKNGTTCCVMKRLKKDTPWPKMVENQ